MTVSNNLIKITFPSLITLFFRHAAKRILAIFKCQIYLKMTKLCHMIKAQEATTA